MWLEEQRIVGGDNERKEYGERRWWVVGGGTPGAYPNTEAAYKKYKTSNTPRQVSCHSSMGFFLLDCTTLDQKPGSLHTTAVAVSGPFCKSWAEGGDEDVCGGDWVKVLAVTRWVKTNHGGLLSNKQGSVHPS